MPVSVLSENLLHRLAILNTYIASKKHKPQLLIFPESLACYPGYGSLFLAVQTEDKCLVRATVPAQIESSFTPLCIDFHLFKETIDLDAATLAGRIDLSSGAFVWDEEPCLGSSFNAQWGIQHDVSEGTPESTRKISLEAGQYKSSFYERPSDKHSNLLHQYTQFPDHGLIPLCAIRASHLKAIWSLVKPYVYKPRTGKHGYIDPYAYYQRVQFSSGLDIPLDQVKISASNTFAITEQRIPLESVAEPFEFAIAPDAIPGLIKGSKKDLDSRTLIFYAEDESLWVEFSECGLEIQVALLPYQDYGSMALMEFEMLTVTLSPEQSTALLTALNRMQTQDVTSVTWTHQGLFAQVRDTVLHTAISVPELGAASILLTPSLLHNALTGLSGTVQVHIQRYNKGGYKLQFISAGRQDTVLSQRTTQKTKITEAEENRARKLALLDIKIKTLHSIADLLDCRNRQGDYGYLMRWYPIDQEIFIERVAEAQTLLREIESLIEKF